MAEKYPHQEIRDSAQLEHFREDYDEISIKDLILNLWRARARIVIATLTAALIIFTAAGTVFLLQKKASITKLEFRLEFQGADRGEYPNGMKFSSADILANPVLDKVYRENDLQRFLKFSDFKAALAVYQTNDKLSFLEYEYAQKLSEKNLNVENRQRLEAEFLEKKKNLLVPIYSLVFAREQRTASLPGDLAAKVLNDILNAWALYAERVKGANQYQIELVSRNILTKENVQSEDYLIGTDLLRLTIQRIKADLAKLVQLPGAKIIQVGKEGTSLIDLHYRINDLDQFKVSPLFGLIQRYGITRSPELTFAYLENRLFEANLKKDQTSSDMNVYESSLDQYLRRSSAAGSGVQTGGAATLPQAGLTGNVPAMIPQFDGSFLNSLIQMAQENTDAQFRQGITQSMIKSGLLQGEMENDVKYYEKLYSSLKQTAFTNVDTKVDEGLTKTAIEQIQTTQVLVYEQLMQTIDQMNAIYKELSSQNLNPDSILFTVTSPVVTSIEKTLPLKKLLIYIILALFFVEGAIFVGVLLAGNGKKAEVGR